MRGRFSDDWVAPRVVLGSETVARSNREAVDRFVQGRAFTPADGHPDRTDIQRHDVCEHVPLRDVLAQLLIQMRITGTTDSQRNVGMLLQLSKALEDNEAETCIVYRMSPTERRRRSVDANGEVTNLYQGEAPVNPRERRGEVYPGDRAIRDDNTVTVQIHRLDLTQENNVVARDVPVIAVWVPAQLARGWIVQAQPGQPD
jgi:hypothetical protein